MGRESIAARRFATPSGYAVRTAPRPAGAGWTRRPSVTTGGAPSFWHRIDPLTGASEWYAYDRIAGEWRYSGPDAWAPEAARYVPQSFGRCEVCGEPTMPANAACHRCDAHCTCEGSTDGS